MTYNRKKTIKEQSIRLANIAKKLHGANLLAKAKSPGLYKNNPWIKKSMVISGESKKINNKDDSVLPNTIRFSLPSDWRM